MAKKGQKREVIDLSFHGIQLTDWTVEAEETTIFKSYLWIIFPVKKIENENIITVALRTTPSIARVAEETLSGSDQAGEGQGWIRKETPSQASIIEEK